MMRAWAWVRGHPAVSLAAGAVLAAFLLGRATAPRPAKVEERSRAETATTATTATVEHRDEHRRTDTVRRTVRLDPGTGKPVERVTERTRELAGVSAAVETQAREEARTVTITEKVTEYRRADLRLRVDAGWRDVQLRPDVWTGAVELRVAGPVWLGAGYGTDKVARLSAAVEF